MSDIEQIIKDIDKLKPIPQITNKVMSIAEDPQSSMTELSDIIIYDQALTANILRACNSAYFGLQQKIDSVHQAIVYMGIDQVVDIVLMTGGAENLRQKQEGYDLEEGELWKYSVSSALVARDLAELKGSKNNHLVFTAALLKDIGKVILNQYVADSFERINYIVSKRGVSFMEAERRVIGIDHAELGGMVAEKWEFSPKMINIIKDHHMHGGLSDIDFETAIVYLADTLCMMMGIGVGSDGLAYNFHQDVIEHLGFNERELQEIIAGFGDKIKEVEDLINLS